MLRLVRPRHRRELELGHKQRAEQVRFVMTEFTFRKVGDEQASVVHQERDAHTILHLAENVANDRTGQELAELVLNRGDGFSLKARVVAGVFLLPERPDERVFDLADDPGAIRVVGQQPVHAEQRRVLAIEQCGDGVIEDVFQARPPGIGPEALESADNAGGNQRPVVGRDLGEQVQADGEVEVAGVEIDQVIGPGRGNVVEQFFGKIAMRVNEADAMIGGDVLHD